MGVRNDNSVDFSSYARAKARLAADRTPKKRRIRPSIPDLGARFLTRKLRAKGYRSRRLQTSVGRIHALEARGGGGLPPVLVLHGLSANGATYESLLERLRPKVRRVYALDMPGHGLSDTPAEGMSSEALRAGLREALTQLVDEPVVIFGNSLGGAAAIRLATELPEAVRGLALAAPGGAPIPAEELARFVAGFDVSSHARALDFVDRLFHGKPKNRHFLAWGVRQQFGQENVSDLLSKLSSADFLAPEELSSLDVPTLVLWGEADRILWTDHRAFFETHLPEHAQVRRLRHFGHVPHLDHPDELASHVLELLKRCARPDEPVRELPTMPVAPLISIA